METDSSPEAVASPTEPEVTAPEGVTEVTSEASPSPELTEAEREQQFRDRTLYCLQEIIAPYQDGQTLTLYPELQPYVGQLKTLKHKITQGALQIAVFGYVSRGKSALLNGLMGEPILPIGAMNGVTQWPRSLQWEPFKGEEDSSPALKIELVDTPGLDEIDGSDRAQMALDIAQASDILLFVIAGKPNRSELASLKQLQTTHKPVLLISNKADLFPDLDRERLWTELEDETLQQWIQPESILLTAANPAAKQVRHEWPDGRVTEEWEVPKTDISEVLDRLKDVLIQQGFQSLMRNALEQAEQTQTAIAKLSLSQNLEEAQQAQLRYVGIKAATIALLPIWWLDAPVNLVLDLLLVRALVNLYQLPTTKHNVEELWRTIFFSLFGVLLCDAVSGIGLGIGSSMGGGFLSGLLLWVSTATLQAIAAGYGAQRVGAATQTYLNEGCSWTPQGPSALLAELKSEPQILNLD